MAKRETRKTTDSTSKRGETTKRASSRRTPARGEAAVHEERSQDTPNMESQGGGTGTATMNLTHDQIADRAKQIWQQHGCPDGEDERNWREAEKQLKQEMGIE